MIFIRRIDKYEAMVFQVFSTKLIEQFYRSIKAGWVTPVFESASWELIAADSNVKAHYLTSEL